MDRNYIIKITEITPTVALRKESVDRNSYEMSSKEIFWASLSARRAWIEITIVSTPFLLFTVALRKESVDRNIWSFVARLIHL